MRFLDAVRKQLIMPTKPTEETGAKPPARRRKRPIQKNPAPRKARKKHLEQPNALSTPKPITFSATTRGTAGIADGGTAAIAAIGGTVAVSMGESETESRMPPAIWSS
jgi:hypothetical protein